MGIFSGKEKESEEEIERLRETLKRVQADKKKLAAELAQERARATALTSQMENGEIEIAKMKVALVKSRQRQKGSVERANRFKARLAEN